MWGQKTLNVKRRVDIDRGLCLIFIFSFFFGFSHVGEESHKSCVLEARGRGDVSSSTTQVRKVLFTIYDIRRKYDIR